MSIDPCFHPVHNPDTDEAIVLQTDGAVDAHGQSGIGFVAYDVQSGDDIIQDGYKLQTQRSTVATEVIALRDGLKALSRSYGRVDALRIELDLKVLVDRLPEGRAPDCEDAAEAFFEVKRRLREFESVSIQHISGKENQADGIAKEVLDP